MMSTPPVFTSATWVAVSGMARKIRCLNAGFPRQCWSNASRRMSWSRFHSTNFHGPVPTGDVVPKAWSPTVSMCFLFTIGKKTSRSSRRGNGLSVMMCTVSASITFTSLIARMLPYWGDFLVWSMTRSNEYFTSAGVMTSPLWKRTFFRILNSHTVSEIAFHDVASDGSNCSLVDRCSRESNMLMLTRIPTRSKCMWGSSVGAWDTSATVKVSLACATAGMGATAHASKARTTASGAHRFMRVSSSGHGDRGVEGAAVASELAERISQSGRPAQRGAAKGSGLTLRHFRGARRCRLERRKCRNVRPDPRLGEGSVEGLGEVGDQVVGILDTDREADQVVLDPDLLPLLAGELVEAHDRGLLDEALHPAQGGGDEGDRARVHHPGGRVQVARDLEGHHPAEAPHLLAGDLMLGVAGQAGVMHPRDARMAGEKLGHRLGVGVLPLHAQGEGLEAAHQQVGREGIDHRAGDALEPPDAADQVGGAEHRAGQQVIEAAQVLGGGMHHEVDAPLERALVVGGGERGVDHRLHPVAPPDPGEALQVQDAVVGIGGRLAHQHPGGRLDRILQRLVVPRRHRGDLDAVAREGLVEELAGAPVAVVGHHHVGAAREHREQRGGHRPHPAREEQAVARTLQRRELGLRDALGRVAVAAVLDPLDLAVEVVLQLD